MHMAIMSPFTSKYHGMPHWKWVLRCCDKCPSIVLPSQEENKDTTNTCPTIRFNVYRNVSFFNIHGRRQYHKGTTCSFFSTVLRSDRTAKVYTWNKLLLLETSITKFHENYYISAIQKLAFHLPHVRILITHHCGKERREELKLRVNLHYSLIRRDYTKQVVSSFSHQIQS